MLGAPADQADDASRSSGRDEVVLMEPQSPMKQLLNEAKSLAPDMVESKDMCLHVLERLERISILAETSNQQTPLQTIDRFSGILRAYVDFLKKFANKKAALRLVYNRTVVSQNLTFHDDIDNLLRGLNFPEDDWRQRWERYRDAQQAAFEAMRRDRMALIGDLRDAHAQTEALSMLMFEFNKVNSKYTPKELKVLNNAFNIVSQNAVAWGAFATVHHGRHCGSHVAIKRAKISSEADRAAFVKEANIWYHANRIPNVVRLFGAYQFGSDPYFVCEYAANGTLGDYLFMEEHRHLTWKLLLQAANGLKALHHLKIVHNNLKCNNILVASDGMAKLADFGSSCNLSSDEAPSIMNAFGAAPWKAPEILTKASPPSFASDVYSFAMCVYEAVSHAVPWTGAVNTMIRRYVRLGRLPPRHENFTDEQWALVKSMCARSPDDRLSMDEVVQQLQKFAGAEYESKLSVQRYPEPELDSHSPEAEEEPIPEPSDAIERTETLGHEACPNLQENESLCRLLVGDMLKILASIRTGKSIRIHAKDTVMELIEEVCTRLQVSCSKHSLPRSIFYALARNRHVTQELEVICEMVYSLSQILKTEQNQERNDAWTELLLIREAQMKFQLMVTHDLSEILPHHASQLESLPILRCELGLAARLGSHTASTELGRVYKKIASFYAMEIETTPTWFIPQYAMDCAANAIGEGNFGVVYRGALQLSDKENTPVAVKTLRMYGLGGALSNQSFIDGVTQWHNLSHENIIELYGAYHVSRKAFLVYELAEGGNLLEYLRHRENKFMIWNRFTEAVQGLQYLHEMGIVHDSLRCSNILVAKNGTVKLTDFGFGAVRTAVGALGGNDSSSHTNYLQWTAPECLALDGTDPTDASDVYSLGMCILEALMEGSPWGKMDELTVLREIEGGHLPECPTDDFQDAWDVVRDMCATDPSRRLRLDRVKERLWELTQTRCYQNNPKPKLLQLQSSRRKQVLLQNRSPTSDGKQIVKYKVKVQLSNGMEFSVWRRYSEFM